MKKRKCITGSKPTDSWTPLEFLSDVDPSNISFTGNIQINVQDKQNGSADLSKNPLSSRVFGVKKHEYIEFGASFPLFVPAFNRLCTSGDDYLSVTIFFSSILTDNGKILTEFTLLEGSGIETNRKFPDSSFYNRPYGSEKTVDGRAAVSDLRLQLPSGNLPPGWSTFKGIGSLAYIPESDIRPIYIEFFSYKSYLRYIYFKIPNSLFERWKSFMNLSKNVVLHGEPNPEGEERINIEERVKIE